MKTTQPINSTVYKIYSDNGLLYVGMTTDFLSNAIYDHFFGKSKLRKINIECVSQIEYASLPSEADAAVYEIYLINKLKPALNSKKRTGDALTIELPPLPFQTFYCEQMEVWKRKIQDIRSRDDRSNEIQRQIEMEKKQKRREIFKSDGLKNEDKERLYLEWLLEYYEPIRNSLL